MSTDSTATAVHPRDNARNLVVLCDGTSNTFDHKKPTAVRRISESLVRDDSQLVYYQPGVGTLSPTGPATWTARKFYQVRDFAFAGDFNEHVAAAYRYVVLNWRSGDKVFLIGFSRGGYVARVLAGMLHGLGLVRPSDVNLIPYAVRLFRLPQDEAAQDFVTVNATFRRHYARPVEDFEGSPRPAGAEDEGEGRRTRGRHAPSVAFLGAWDTVTAVGTIRDGDSFPHTDRLPNVAVVRHAVALDEWRSRYLSPLLGPRAGDTVGEVPVDHEERWFPGVHSDVGASDGKDTLWRPPYRWVAGEAERLGLRFLDGHSPVKVPDGARKCPPVGTHARWWRPLQWVPVRFFDRMKNEGRGAWVKHGFRGKQSRTVPAGSRIDSSAIARMRACPRYRPLSLNEDWVRRQSESSEDRGPFTIYIPEA